MKKNLLVMAPVAILAGMAIVMISCGKDDDNAPPAKAAISFELEEATVSEDAGTKEYTIILDKPAPEDLVLEIELTGTASNKADVGEDGLYDYEVVGDPEEIEIAEGETEAVIKIKFWSDLILEETPETIILKIDDADSDNNLVTIGDDNELTITVVNENGTLVGLEWVDKDKDGINEACDMDIIFWAKPEGSEELEPFPLDGLVSAPYKDTQPEYLFYPDVIGFADDDYAYSYTYYDGQSDSLLFQAFSVRFEDGDYDAESVAAAAGIYKLVNRNKWYTQDAANRSFIIAQNFSIENNLFKNFEPDTIIAPSESSRLKVKSGSPDSFRLMQNLVVSKKMQRQTLSSKAEKIIRGKSIL